MFTSFLFSEDRDRYIQHIKQSLLDDANIKIPEEYRFFAKEWQQSAEHGISRRMKALPESTRDMHVFERVNDFDKFRLSYLSDYYMRRDEVLEVLGCAIFYLDEHLSVYRKSGDAELLSRLRSKGLRLSSTLTEKNVGIFVANIAENYPDKVICRVGNENFLDIFSEYACFAHYWNEERRGANGAMLVITPVENCSVTVQNVVDFLLSVEDITHEIYYPFTKKRGDALEAYIYERNNLELFLDEHGEVIFTSRHFEEIFGKAYTSGPPPGIGQFMPELSYLVKFFDEDRNPCQTREVMLITAEKKNGFFLAIPEIIRTYNGQKCLHCTLQHSVKKKNPSQSGGNAGSKVRYNFDSIIGESESVQKLKEYAGRAAEGGSNVLILGESGTGKEMFAQAIHSAGKKRGGPFVPINCASLPKDLLNSELFGYEEGAFTGAMKGGSAGKFEQANGGTIFLDEIGDMPLEMQSALLRVLEDNTVVRVGGKKYIPVDIRVIAATNQNLWRNVQKGSFRADLYFRLNIVTIKIPPLSERRDDIPALTEHMLDVLCAKTGGSRREISPELVELLQGYSWPGNVRELRNVIERCMSYSRSAHITVSQLPEELVNMLSGTVSQSNEPAYWAAPESADTGDWRGYDRDRVVALMHQYGGNKSRVAKELGISRATFYKRLKEFGIN